MVAFSSSSEFHPLSIVKFVKLPILTALGVSGTVSPSIVECSPPPVPRESLLAVLLSPPPNSCFQPGLLSRS